MQLLFVGDGRKLFLDVEEGVLSLNGLPVAKITTAGFRVGDLLFGSIVPGHLEMTDLTTDEPPVTTSKPAVRRGRKPKAAPVEEEPALPVYEQDGEDETEP